MESRILVLLSTLCLLSATAWAGDAAPRCRCLPNVWTSKMNLNQGMKIGDGGPSDYVAYAEGTYYADVNKGWLVVVMDMTPGGKLTVYQQTGSPFMYVRTAVSCLKMKTLIMVPSGTFCWFNKTEAAFKGTERLGKEDVEVWHLTDASSGVLMKMHLSILSPELCFPSHQINTITKEGVAYTQGLLFTDFKSSIEDPSVLNLPDECRDAVLYTPASGAQIKTMSFLALVLILALHLGY